ncbi:MULTISPECIES: MOSC domain-containing protein [Halomonadaceae]|uniref:MOSC domain-containing protein n=1 Tax=Halomonadaceae TaxID=28256 RepID=UPI0015982CE1|nr:MULTISPECIES: MOSC N-terminal beta barrel domain-containing protein [Halomonas]QJQ95839.1 MOSC domain-containing protein [Halomonas sp. PA5]
MNQSLRLSALYRYPIKSTAGEALTEAVAGEEGLEGDRRYMVTRPDGSFVTARTHPHLQRVSTTLRTGGVTLHHPALPDLSLTHEEFSALPSPAQVWSDSFVGLATTREADEWCSQALGESVKLLWLGERSPRYRQAIGKRVSFADGYPLLLIGQASLDELNTRLRQPHRMAQFRPNLVVTGSLPYAEDEWHVLRIGEVELIVDAPCSRCAMITVDPDTGRFMADKGEPLRTLAGYRRGVDGKVYFGQNLIVAKGGTLQVGAPVEIIG